MKCDHKFQERDAGFEIDMKKGILRVWSEDLIIAFSGIRCCPLCKKGVTYEI